MAKSNQRINLLTDQQIQELYDIPKLSSEGQEHFFELSNDEKFVMYSSYKSLKTQAAFVLQLGYFKATHLFFDEIQFYKHRFDIAYILRNVIGETQHTLSGKLGYDTKAEQQRKITSLEGFVFWRNADQNKVANHLKWLLRTHANPVDALKELLVYFKREQIVLPSYRNLQDLFSQCLTYEGKRLDKIIFTLPDWVTKELDNIIKNNEVLANLSDIKGDQRGFQLHSVTQAVNVTTQIADLYQFLQGFLTTLNVAQNCIDYYAELAEKYSVSRIRILRKPLRWLYVLCFIYVKYQLCVDNLINSFIYHYRMLEKEAKDYAVSEEIKYNAQVQKNYPKISALLRYIPSDVIHPGTLYKDFLLSAYKLLPKEEFAAMADALDGKGFDKESAKWNYIEEKSRIVALYLRPLMLNVIFNHTRESSNILQLINILKNHYGKKRSPSKLKVQENLKLNIPANVSKYLSSDKSGCYHPVRFEFYVYKKMFHALDAGTLF